MLFQHKFYILMADIDSLTSFIPTDTLLTNNNVFCCRLKTIQAHQSPCVWSEWRERGAEVGPTREPRGGDKLHHNVQKGSVKGFILTGTVLLFRRFVIIFFHCKEWLLSNFFLAFIFTFWIEFSLPKLTVPGSVQMYLVRNLQPNTLYEFQIVANGPFGKSKSAALGSALNSGKRNIRN